MEKSGIKCLTVRGMCIFLLNNHEIFKEEHKQKWSTLVVIMTYLKSYDI